jgi:hypothetical protein
MISMLSVFCEASTVVCITAAGLLLLLSKPLLLSVLIDDQLNQLVCY